MEHDTTPTETTAQLLNFARDYDGDLILTLRVFDPERAIEPLPTAGTLRLHGELMATPDVEARLLDAILPDEHGMDFPDERGEGRQEGREQARTDGEGGRATDETTGAER